MSNVSRGPFSYRRIRVSLRVFRKSFPIRLRNVHVNDFGYFPYVHCRRSTTTCLQTISAKSYPVRIREKINGVWLSIVFLFEFGGPLLLFVRYRVTSERANTPNYHINVRCRPSACFEVQSVLSDLVTYAVPPAPLVFAKDTVIVVRTLRYAWYRAPLPPSAGPARFFCFARLVPARSVARARTSPCRRNGLICEMFRERVGGGGYRAV